MKRYIQILTVTSAVLLVAACMQILSFTHPETAPVNSDVNVSIGVGIDIEGSIDVRHTPVVSILVPAAWNPADIVMTYSSVNAPGGPFTGSPMRLATASDVEVKTGLGWNAALLKKLGTKGNYDPVQWVTFIDNTTHPTWVGGVSFTATINIKFKTGSENLRAYLAYFIGNTQDGVHDDTQYFLLRDILFETTGGSNALHDYTVPKMWNIVPEKFTWKDIVRFNYDATIQVDGEDSPLKGADAIYFMATATYNGTQTVTVDAVSSKTLMKEADDDKWFLYMYPNEFFGLPSSVKIENIDFYMVNQDKSITVRMPDGSDFTLPENCE